MIFIISDRNSSSLSLVSELYACDDDLRHHSYDFELSTHRIWKNWLIFDTLKFEVIYWVNNSTFCVWIRNSRNSQNDVVLKRIERRRDCFYFLSWSRIDRRATLLCFQRFSRCQNSRFTITEMRIWMINVCNCWKCVKFANIRFANCKNIERVSYIFASCERSKKRRRNLNYNDCQKMFWLAFSLFICAILTKMIVLSKFIDSISIHLTKWQILQLTDDSEFRLIWHRDAWKVKNEREKIAIKCDRESTLVNHWSNEYQQHN